MRAPNPHSHLVALFLVVLLLTGCDNTPRPTNTITILAAASLTESLTDITTAYESEYPDASITLAFAGSQILAAQILEGARFDLFLSADQFQMDRVRDLVGAPIPFAHGRLVVITPAASNHPDALIALESATRIAIAAPEVPAGRYAIDACKQLGLWDMVRPKTLSLEESVRGALTRVIMGEADAGIVYASDTRAAPANSIRIHELPDTVTVRAQYLAAISDAASNPTAAQAFLDCLTTNEQAQRILSAHAFDTP